MSVHSERGCASDLARGKLQRQVDKLLDQTTPCVYAAVMFDPIHTPYVSPYKYAANEPVAFNIIFSLHDNMDTCVKERELVAVEFTHDGVFFAETILVRDVATTNQGTISAILLENDEDITSMFHTTLDSHPCRLCPPSVFEKVTSMVPKMQERIRALSDQVEQLQSPHYVLDQKLKMDEKIRSFTNRSIWLNKAPKQPQHSQLSSSREKSASCSRLEVLTSYCDDISPVSHSTASVSAPSSPGIPQFNRFTIRSPSPGGPPSTGLSVADTYF